LGNFSDSAVVTRVLHYTLQGPLRPQELTAVMGAIYAARPEFRERLFEWMLANYAAISTRIPPYYVSSLPRYAGGCSLERINRARGFFSQPARRSPGTMRQMEKTASSVNDCLSLHEREGDAVRRYLMQFAAR